MHARSRTTVRAIGLVATWLALAGTGCGTDVIVVASEQNVGGAGGSDHLFLDGGGGAGSGIGDGPGGSGGLPEYIDPGCPNRPPPREQFDCDPYQEVGNQCPLGEACYIYVQYPSEPCGEETYGSGCAEAGSGEVGSRCGGGQRCAQGLACVITGAGTQCLQLCRLSGSSGCPPGLVCEPIDVAGFGGCL